MDRRFEQQKQPEEEAGESKGVPIDIWDKPADYEEVLPFLKRTVGFVKQYERSKPKGREILYEQLVNTIIKDIKTLKHVLDNLELIAQVKPDVDLQVIKAAIVKHLEQTAARRSVLSTWTPEKIEQLIKMGLDASGELVQVVQAIKAKLFNAPQNIEESVDLHYNTAWAMAETIDPDVREELVSILCYEKEWFNELSLPAFYFTFGSSGVTDDEHIKKYYAVSAARAGIANYTSTEHDGTVPLNSLRLQHVQRKIQEAASQVPFTAGPKVGMWLLGLLNANSVRYQMIRQYFANDPIEQQYTRMFDEYKSGIRIDLSQTTKELVERENKLKNLTWPYNLKHDPDEPLISMINKFIVPQMGRVIWAEGQRARGHEIITESPIQITEKLSFLAAAIGYDTPEQRSQLVRQIYKDLQAKYQDSLKPEGNQINKDLFQFVFLQPLGIIRRFSANDNTIYFITRILPEEEIGRLSSILEYHRPMIHSEQVAPIRHQINSAKASIETDFARSIGKRGYEMAITDTTLRNLGYTSIVFRGISRGNIKIALGIGGQDYIFQLDPAYRIISGGDIKRFQNPVDQAWLELLVMSHLKKLMCTEDEEEVLKSELVGGERQYEVYRKQVVGRKEHPRRLPPGQHFSSEAFNKCLKSQFPESSRNLLELNRLRALAGKGGTLETGLWTYVSGSEWVDSEELKPIKVAFKNAADDIRAVIPLGQVSEAELARIEKEILGELGI